MKNTGVMSQMETTNKNVALNEAKAKIDTLKSLKEYKSPTLTSYGDISELVLAMGGLGTDGFPIPSLSLT